MADYNAYTFEIYQKTEEWNKYFCKVTAGKFGFTGIATPVFQPMEDLYDIPLNGLGRNKALKKINERIRSDGLDLMLITDDSDVVVLDRP